MVAGYDLNCEEDGIRSPEGAGWEESAANLGAMGWPGSRGAVVAGGGAAGGGAVD